MPTRNPFIGLSRSPDDGGWTNEETMLIGDIIKSIMKNAAKDPGRSWNGLPIDATVPCLQRREWPSN